MDFFKRNLKIVATKKLFLNLFEAWFILITAQKMKFSIKDFMSKCDQIRSLLRIWPHLLEKSLMEIFILCAVDVTTPV